MKILYFNYLYDVEESSVGAAAHVCELAKSLRVFGHRVEVCSLNVQRGSSSSVGFTVRGVLKKHGRRHLHQFSMMLKNVRYFLEEWRMIHRARPDVLLIRYDMQNFSAVVAAALKRIPVVILSCSDSERDVETCMDAGASAFVLKDGSYDNLRQSIMRITDFWSQTRRVPAAAGEVVGAD